MKYSLDRLLGNLGSEKKQTNYENKQMNDRYLTTLTCLGLARKDFMEIGNLLQSRDSSAYYWLGCRIQTLQIWRGGFKYFLDDSKKYEKAIDKDTFLKGRLLQLDVEINEFEQQVKTVFRKSEKARLFLSEEERRLYIE